MSKGKVEIPISRVPGLDRVEKELTDRLDRVEKLLRDQDQAVVKMYKAMADIVGATADKQRRLIQVVSAVCELVGPRKVAELLDLRGRGYYTDIPADFLQDIADFIECDPEVSEVDIY